ncbi:MAG: DUF3592 domain-containing protein [Deltaproteobacteria bacterium]|nr:DUF3592 domain-containing protein [Deltaproteobacteria bacterium]
MSVFKVIGTVFGLAGVALIVPALVLAWNTQSFRSAASRAGGVVVAGDGSHEASPRPVVRFSLPNGDEVQIVGDVRSTPPAYEVGEKVDVLYDPAAPRQARIDSILEMWFIPLLLGALGLVFAAIGLAFLLWLLYRSRQVAWLKANGRRLQAKIQQVTLDTRVRANRRHPYRIVGEWLDAGTNTVHIFESEMLWFDPSRYLTRETIDVLYDPANLRRYWVDTSFLPKVSE